MSTGGLKSVIRAFEARYCDSSMPRRISRRLMSCTCGGTLGVLLRLASVSKSPEGEACLEGEGLLRAGAGRLWRFEGESPNVW